MIKIQIAIRIAVQVLLFFTPRFVTEDVAVNKTDDGNFIIVCCMDDVLPHEVFDGILATKSLVFMCWGFLWTVEEQVRPWPKKGIWTL